MANNRSQPGELKQFVEEMERCIQKLGAPPVKKKEEFLKYQENQVDGLVALEDLFRKKLVEGPKGKYVYDQFCEYVKTLNSSMSARSYFRERQENLKDTLGPAMIARDMTVLSKFRFNYRFVQWALKLKVLDASYHRIAAKMRKLRHEMILLLMPLAINRTRMFCGRTTRTHITIRDQAQAAMEGVITAVDKYTPPFSSVYRAVAIGRILGHHIQENSATLLHFLSLDQKILYRAHKIVSQALRRGDGSEADHEATAKQLNAESEGTFTTNADEVALLLSAASHITTDASEAAGGARRTVVRLVAPEDQAPDKRAEFSEGMDKMRGSLGVLTVKERKLLALKGMIRLEDV